jgi:phage-related protein
LQQAPHIRKIAGKKYSPLWELRIETTGNAFRIFYFMFDQNRSILLHGIKKKADKTPPKDLETALERMKDYLQRN